MNIVSFLIENQYEVLGTLAEIDPDSSDVIRVREKIEKHIRHFELYESLEGSFLKRGRNVLGENTHGPMIHFCESGNAWIWGLLDQLTQALRAERSASVRQVFEELAAFEKLHFNFKTKSLFPLLQSLVDAQTLEFLGQGAMRFYRRFYPTLGVSFHKEEINPFHRSEWNGFRKIAPLPLGVCMLTEV